MGTDDALPDAELEVLACLWQKGEATARDVREAMASYRPLTHSAVSTLLARLQEKGLVGRRKGPVGKAFLFRATDRPSARGGGWWATSSSGSSAATPWPWSRPSLKRGPRAPRNSTNSKSCSTSFARIGRRTRWTLVRPQKGETVMNALVEGINRVRRRVVVLDAARRVAVGRRRLRDSNRRRRCTPLARAGAVLAVGDRARQVRRTAALVGADRVFSHLPSPSGRRRRGRWSTLLQADDR